MWKLKRLIVKENEKKKKEVEANVDIQSRHILPGMTRYVWYIWCWGTIFTELSNILC